MIYLILTFIFFINFNAESKEYKFVGAYFPQITEQTSNGEVQGLGVKITNLIAEDLNVKIDIKIYPLKRALEIIKQGKADAIIGAYKSKERSTFIDYSNLHFYEDPLYIYSNIDSKIKWNNNLDALTQYKIGALRGWSLGKKFDASKAKLDVLYVSYLTQLFSMLELKRLDLIIAHPRSIAEFLQEKKIKNYLKPLGQPIASMKGYFGFRKDPKLAQFKKDFEKSFKKLLAKKKFKIIHIKSIEESIDKKTKNEIALAQYIFPN